MTRAVAGNSTWSHFPTLSQELGDDPQILVIDRQSFVCAETTDFTTKHRSTTRRSLFVVHSFPACPSVPLSLCHKFTCLALKLAGSRSGLKIKVLPAGFPLGGQPFRVAARTLLSPPPSMLCVLRGGSLPPARSGPARWHAQSGSAGRHP